MVMWNVRQYYFALFMVFYVFYHPTDSGAVLLTAENIDKILATNELVFINFYAEWCRFSNLLAPIFDEAADKVKKEFPDEGKVVFGKVDCDRDKDIATRFHISKYPTLKIVRNSRTSKREYRGQRSSDAFLEFVKKELEDPVKEFQNLQELQNLDLRKPVFVGYFDRRDEPAYNTFRKVATNLKDECQFHAGFGQASKVMHPAGVPIVAFRPDSTTHLEKEETYDGVVDDFNSLITWVQEKCISLVREITFANAEELTEEGLPFLILFYHPNNTECIKDYKTIIKTQLINEKQNMNFLTADGVEFSHPLHHLGKSENDLPLIAIDSFRHMYLFPKFEDMYKPGKLKQFLQDLYSGKLHREFHYGPDLSSNDITDFVSTSPPESAFKKLGPSKNRYTLLDKDEL